MSKGPGRIERRIEAIFDAEPDNALVVQELCERVYDVPKAAVQKAHRVAVIRAAKNVASRRPEFTWQFAENRGRTLVFCRWDNPASYALGYIKAEQWYPITATRYRGWASEEEIRQRAADFMQSHLDLRYGWYREQQRFIAERDGDNQRLAEIAAMSDKIHRMYFS